MLNKHNTILVVSDALKQEYGTPDLGNLPDPLDELVYIVMSTMTTNQVHKRIFSILKSRFPTWEAVLDEPVESLTQVLKPAGLSRQKGTRIYEILRMIQQEHPDVSLNFLRQLAPKEAESYLLGLPGVGKKVARCVLIYSLGMDAFPVDAHVFRVCKRLGWIPNDMSWSKAHDVLQSIVPASRGHDLHVNMVVHGRQICHANKPPSCSKCCIRLYCNYYKSST